jgi:hypothetical protein
LTRELPLTRGLVDADDRQALRELQDIILNGGLRLPGFDHWRERVASKPSDPDDVRWDCSCGYSGSPEKVQRHWRACRDFANVIVEADARDVADDALAGLVAARAIQEQIAVGAGVLTEQPRGAATLPPCRSDVPRPGGRVGPVA